MTWTILTGDNRETLKTIPDDSIDSIVTDPPYGIDFLGKAWDANVGALETYRECLRVLKPGGHILAFSAARTYHHLAVTLEQAGFEIRDQIMWIYSSGFPKSQDVGRSIQRSLGVKESIKRKKTDGYNLNNQREFSETKVGYAEMKPIAVCTDSAAKAWEGWGTALKPAHEPICLARKPMKLSIAKNCQTHGVGALNIDATRVPFASDLDRPSGGENGWSRVGFSEEPVEKYRNQKKKKSDVEIYLDNKRGPMERARIADGENIGMFAGGVGYRAIKREVDPAVDLPAGRFPSNVIGEIPDYQKYFYCPKVSRRERHVGFDANKIATNPGGMYDVDGTGQQYNPQKKTGDQGNNHPTVKPIELMKYLIRLITPPGGHVLDPFAGSGSTGMAAVELGHDFTGCELDPAYVTIAQRRIEAWRDITQDPLQRSGLFDVE